MPSTEFRITLPEPLHTARLTLRRWVAADVDAFAAVYSGVEVHRYLYSTPAGPDDLPDLFGRRLTDPTVSVDRTPIRLAAEVTATGRIVGEVLLILHSAEHRQGEIGYVLLPEAVGNGYATEAAAALLSVGFAAGLHRIVARADARNAASIAVMERVGLRREALLRQNESVKGEWTDEIVYALLASEHTPTGVTFRTPT